MLKAELLEIIASGENSGVEFKRDDVRPEQVAKEIVAMANVKGGRLLLGVEDDGSITGIQRECLEEWVMDAVFGAKVHPLLLPFYEEVLTDNGKRVAVVTFTEGTAKPYVVRHQSREDIFIRVGSTSRMATREQQARLFASGGMLHTELLPVSGAGLNSLDRQRLTDYLGRVLRDAELPERDDQWESRLSGLGFMTEGVDEQRVCTIAGLVLFGHHPRRFLRQAGIRCLAFEFNDRTYAARLDENLDLPMVALWDTDDSSGTQRDSDGLIEALSQKMHPFVSTQAGEVDEELRRDRQWLYPVEAIRETVVNALAHRDWTRFADVEVCVYADRLEILSPGALPNTMTLEKMVAGQRMPRNPIIVDVLRDYGYVDARGMGVRNKIIPLVREATGEDPIFQDTEDFLRTTIPTARRHQ